jgi:alpha-tubulin suppressor-like RCC1 family protein
VSNEGKVKAVAPGTATITATSETKTGQATVTVPDASGPVALNTLAVGVDHTCAIGTDQAVYCWGDNKYGELGDGTDADRAVPTKAAVSGQFVMVGAGNHLTCALEKSGAVWCWGSNEYGALGNAGSTTLNRVRRSHSRLCPAERRRRELLGQQRQRSDRTVHRRRQ